QRAVADFAAIPALVVETEVERASAGPPDADIIGETAQPVADDRHVARPAETDPGHWVIAVVLVAGVEEPLAGAGPEGANVLGPVAVPVARDRDVGAVAEVELAGVAAATVVGQGLVEEPRAAAGTEYRHQLRNDHLHAIGSGRHADVASLVN